MGRINFPEKVAGIKIDKTAQSLYFLISSAYTAAEKGTEVGEFTVHYEDNSIQRIKLVKSINIADWWAVTTEGDLPEAKVAWTGSIGMGKEVGIYKLDWENPSPGKKISTLDFLSFSKPCVPILISVTTKEG